MRRAAAFAVLGAGRQGRAAALDLATRAQAAWVLLLDGEEERVRSAASWLDERAGRQVARAVVREAEEPEELADLLWDVDACLSALPYRLNPLAARACLGAGCHYADLGGDPETVAEVLAMDEQAREASLSLVPDCGLAPGLANVVVARALDLAEERTSGRGPWAVRVRCGGLPVEPVGRLGYALVFSPWGLLKEYSGLARIVRAGKIETVPALEGLEEIDFPEPPGRCEAFHTVGGASTLPDSFAGRLESFDYKTVRYPGHCERVRLLADLGLFEEANVLPAGGGTPVSPRALLVSLLEERLPRSVPDLVVLRVEARGPGLDRPVRLELIERAAEDDSAEAGLSAMERCTGFAAAAVVALQAAGEVAPGARAPERAVDPRSYLEGLASRGLDVTGS